MKILTTTKILLVIATVALSGQLKAQQPGYYFMPEIGNVNLSIDSRFTLSNSKLNEDNIETGITGGYRTDNNLLFEVSWLHSDSVDFIDLGETYNFRNARIMLGYQMALNKHINFVPKVGFTFWELEGEEGIFLNPGPEATSRLSGNDLYWSLGFEMPVSENVKLQLNHANNGYEFGRTETTSFGVVIEF